MRKNKKLMLAAILLLGIGFAAVSTTLYINGNVGITANTADFDVKFTSATLDGTDISSTAISADGKTITYGTNDLSMVGDKSTLDFEVTNNSELYDAEVSIECSATGTKADYYSITKNVASTIVAKTKEAGKVDVELIKATTEDITEEFTCTLTATATERTTKGEAAPVGPTYYYAFGTPTTSSTTDFATLGKNVFARLGSDNSTGVCINDGGLFCIQANDYDNSVVALKEHFGEYNCTADGSDVNCNSSDFSCSAYSDGGVYCGDSSASESVNAYADGSFGCIWW